MTTGAHGRTRTRLAVHTSRVLAVAFALVGCSGGDGDAVEPDLRSATTAAPGDANFFLTVSNQSFERPSVFIEVAIDDEPVIAELFAVEGQHNFVGFGFALEPGEHELTAFSAAGAGVGETFTMPEGRPYHAVLLFWAGAEEPPRLDLQFLDDAPGFG